MAIKVREPRSRSQRVRPYVHSPLDVQQEMRVLAPATLGCFEDYEVAEAAVLELMQAGVKAGSFSLLVGESTENLFGHGSFTEALLGKSGCHNALSAALLTLGFSPSTCVVSVITAAQGGCLLVVDAPAFGPTASAIERILTKAGATRWESLAA